MDLEGTTLSKSNIKRQIPYDFTRMWNINTKRKTKQKQTCRSRQQIGGYQKGRGVEGGRNGWKGSTAWWWKLEFWWWAWRSPHWRWFMVHTSNLRTVTTSATSVRTKLKELKKKLTCVSYVHPSLGTQRLGKRTNQSHLTSSWENRAPNSMAQLCDFSSVFVVPK